MSISPVAENVRRTDNMRGVLLMTLAFFSLSICDMLAKLSTSELHPMQVVWTRQLALLAGVIVALSLRGPGFLKTKNPKLQLVRGGLAALSASCFVSGVKFVPLADAVAITFVAPFVVTAVSALLLGEKVGPRRWTAVGIGFLGTMVVVRPGLGTFHPAALLVLVAATSFALRQVLSRRLAGADKAGTTVAYTAMVSAVILTLPLPFIWQTPQSSSQILWLAVMAVTAGIGEILLIAALELGEAAVLAPVQYTLIVWSTLWGWAVFHELPDVWTGIGAAIIVATGLYIFQRERAVGVRKSTTPPEQV